MTKHTYMVCETFRLPAGVRLCKHNRGTRGMTLLNVIFTALRRRKAEDRMINMLLHVGVVHELTTD